MVLDCLVIAVVGFTGKLSVNFKRFTKYLFPLLFAEKFNTVFFKKGRFVFSNSLIATVLYFFINVCRKFL